MLSACQFFVFVCFGISITSGCSPGANQYLATFHSRLPWLGEYANPASSIRQDWDRELQLEVDRKLSQDSTARSYFSKVFISNVRPNVTETDVSVTIMLQKPVGPVDVSNFISGLTQTGNLFTNVIPLKLGVPVDISDTQHFTDVSLRSSASSNYVTIFRKLRTLWWCLLNGILTLSDCVVL